MGRQYTVHSLACKSKNSTKRIGYVLVCDEVTNCSLYLKQELRGVRSCCITNDAKVTHCMRQYINLSLVTNTGESMSVNFNNNQALKIPRFRVTLSTPPTSLLRQIRVVPFDELTSSRPTFHYI